MKEAVNMKIIRFIGKIAALPLAVIAAILGFLFNLATNLFGYVIGPAMLLILSLLEGCCLAVLFGQAVVLEFLDNIRDGLFQFVRS